MKQRVAYLALVFGLAGAVSVGCGSDDDTTAPGHGGTSGSAGKAGSAGQGGSSGKGGSANEAGSAGETSPAGSAGTEQGAAGEPGGVAGAGGEGGEGGEGGYTTAQIERGTLIVRSMALCGGCHSVAATGTTPAGPELGGNPAFFSNLGAPNLTNDPSGIGGFSDEQVINAIRNGVALRKTSSDEERHLNAVMPYWLFHNMTDEDALSVVAFLRTSVTPVAATVVTGKADATPVAPLAPSAFPDSSFAPGDADYAAAQQGKYLLSSITSCVKCHSPATAGLPIADFFSGVPPAVTPATAAFASNITPDTDTGIGGWDAADVATALKGGTNKGGENLCGSMPSAGKGYGGMTDADAHAIGVYLTSIPAVIKPTTDPDLEPVPTCTPTPNP